MNEGKSIGISLKQEMFVVLVVRSSLDLAYGLLKLHKFTGVFIQHLYVLQILLEADAKAG